ncbi:MAG: type II/IV secretion system protein [Candidatus Chaera renei]|uniref:Type II/IV secretion system protein n=1 Tax=Candidatus Chaera renei TaxID=2506947 RepID=A0A4Q0AJR3_9BACT|nr:MAG: type II/IV secretion system protein [Candidatus Chaera renei]
MRISDSTIEKLLRSSGKLSDDKLKELLAEEKKTGRPLQDLVLKRELLTDKDLTELYAKNAGIPFVEINLKDLDKQTVSVIPERIAHQYSAVVFKIDSSGVKHIAMEDPDDVQAVDFLQKYIGNKFKLYVATKDNILSAMESYRESVASELGRVIEFQKDADPTQQRISEKDIAEDSPIAQTVNLLLEYAIRADASDIHIEPREENVIIRYRIDGVLREANKLPKNVHEALVSRIKILSNLKIDERRVPQDGRFKIVLAGKRYAFRVSTLPITNGEKVVMRILDESGKSQSLEELGFWGWSLKSLKEAIVQPHGMILVTGPTGSGKSTSLFSILSMLNDPSVNISTVEDPVEYRIPGANQTQVNPQAGMTFIAGLRALLRQDPNIIMVGEIRDGETANLAVQAALTGHLVFSTLHTNNAATCLPRLLDMGIEPFLIASTVRAVVGQRLVRRLCPACREKYQPSDEEMKEIRRIFNLKEDAELSHVHQLEEQAAGEGIGADLGKELNSSDRNFENLWREHRGGCDECNGTGYRGRIGIYEVLANSLEVQKLIVANATSNNIQDQSIKEGMVTMQLDGLIKALRGQTSIEEILRVTRE